MIERWQDAVLNFAAHPLLWPLARICRRVNPFIRVPRVGIVISDAELAHEVLQRDRDFTKNGKGSLSAVMTQVLGPFALANMDGEAHHQLRHRLADVLSPARMEEILQPCADPIRDMCEELDAGRTVDLARVARVVSGRITMEMMGVRPEDAAADAQALAIVDMGERIAAGLRFHSLPERRARALRADVGTLTAHARKSFDAEAGPPSSLVRRLRSLGFSFEETRGILSIFFIAGALTMAVALPRIIALLIDGGQFSRLQNCPDAIGRAIDEGLRFTTPVPMTIRIARRDATVRDHHIRAGTRLVILTANLARDEHLFPAPNQFDVDRPHEPRARNLWFGAGPHFCLGHGLAQRELRLFLQALAGLGGRLRIVRRRVSFRVLLPAYARLEARLERP